MFREYFDLTRAAANIASPFIFHPLSAAETFLPHARPISWLTGNSSFQPDRDIPDLSDKVVLVTGGNTGLGLETILQLARHNPKHIYLGARSADKAKTAIQYVQRTLQQQEIRPCSIEHVPLDLSNFDSVEQAAQRIFATTRRLDILILNAGIMATPPSKSRSGHDLQLCTNHLGHFLLVNLLMPLLERTATDISDADVRVVTVSSVAYNMAPSKLMELVDDQEKLCIESPYVRYGVSKACNILFAAELARRSAQKGILSVSLHPGIILTQLYESSKESNMFLKYGLSSVAHVAFDDVARGALGQLYLSVGAPKDEVVNGAYYVPVGKHQLIDLTQDSQQAAQLWQWSEDQLKDYL